MSLEDLIDASGQVATITQEAPPGLIPPQTAMGGVDRTMQWPSIATLPCHVNTTASPLQPYPTGRNNERQQVYTTRIYFYSCPSIGFTTRMRIAVAGGSDPAVVGTYQIEAVKNPNSMSRLWEIDCERVRTP